MKNKEMKYKVGDVVEYKRYNEPLKRNLTNLHELYIGTKHMKIVKIIDDTYYGIDDGPLNVFFTIYEEHITRKLDIIVKNNRYDEFLIECFDKTFTKRGNETRRTIPLEQRAKKPKAYYDLGMHLKDENII